MSLAGKSLPGGRGWLWGLLITALLAGCATPPAPVATQPDAAPAPSATPAPQVIATPTLAPDTLQADGQ
ncbi:MAG: hypothetical protein MUF08_08250, partial [Burkholderiaceae bacterium]|nr:hypothetical protein [Burkholderiaceae bacterium]